MLCEDLFVGTKLDPDKQARILVDLALLFLLHGETHLLRATHEQTRIPAQKRSKIVTDCFPSNSSECSSAHPAI